MEKFVTLLIPAMLAMACVRLIALPVGIAWKYATHALCGFVCLWLLNTIAPYTGVWLPINAVTVLVAGFLGTPGLGLLALLELL